MSLDVAPLVFVLPADHVSLSHMSLCHVSLDVAPLVFVLPADSLCLGARRVQVEAGAPLPARYIKLLPEVVKMDLNIGSCVS